MDEELNNKKKIRWGVNIWKIMDYKGWIDAVMRKDRSDQTFRGCYGKRGKKKGEKAANEECAQSRIYL